MDTSTPIIYSVKIYRHPFTISEIFGCEVSQINDLFFTAPPIAQIQQQSKHESAEKHILSSPYDTVKVGSSDESEGEEEVKKPADDDTTELASPTKAKEEDDESELKPRSLQYEVHIEEESPTTEVEEVVCEVPATVDGVEIQPESPPSVSEPSNPEPATIEEAPA